MIDTFSMHEAQTDTLQRIVKNLKMIINYYT